MTFSTPTQSPNSSNNSLMDLTNTSPLITKKLHIFLTLIYASSSHQIVLGYIKYPTSKSPSFPSESLIHINTSTVSQLPSKLILLINFNCPKISLPCHQISTIMNIDTLVNWAPILANSYTSCNMPVHILFMLSISLQSMLMFPPYQCSKE